MGNVLSQYRKQKPAPKKRPSNTLSDFLAQALQGYWARQGKLAQEGLTMADQGARQMREGDPAGALGMFAGPANYLMSPVSALVPTGEEIDTARDLPQWSKPLARAASHTALLALPGPDLGPVASSVGNTARRIGDDAAIAFGAEVPEGVTVYGAGPILKKPGLGRGMADLAGDATDAELAALKARLEAEAAQTGTGAAPATRDQALLNLTGGGAGQSPGPAEGILGGAAPQSYSSPMKIGTLKEAQDAHKRAVEIAKEYGFTPSEADLAYTGSAYQDLTLRNGKKYSTVSLRSADHPEPSSRINNGFGAHFSFEPHGKFDEGEIRKLFAAKREKLGLPPIESGGPAEGIIAYHGSPHTFDKFDMSQIGTGEGSQAFGHGLYFAENPKVAQSYKPEAPNEARTGRLLRGGRPVTKTNLDFEPELEWADAAILSGEDPVAFARRMAVEAPEGAEMFNAIADKFERGVYAAAQAPVKGSMYQVRINAKPDEFLDWDKPLSEQPKAVRKVLEDYQGKHDDPSVVTAGDIARDRSGNGSDVYFAADLKKAGVKGIRYKDAGSRSGEGGTYNYVVFDDKIIDILKRYGIPMTVGVGGGVVVTGANMPPDLAAQMGDGVS